MSGSLTVMLMFFSASTYGALGAKPGCVRVQSPDIDGLRLTAEVQRQYVVGRPVAVRIVVTNSCEAGVVVQTIDSDPPSLAVCLTHEGKPVPPTRYGATFVPNEAGEISAELGKLMDFVATSSSPVDLSIKNLALLYDLTLPGEYVLQLERSLRLGEGASARNVQLITPAFKFRVVSR